MLNKIKIANIIILLILCILPLNSCYVGYGLGNEFIEENFEYEINAITKKVSVSRIYLKREEQNVEITIPDKTNDGYIVESIGAVTKGGNFFHVYFEEESIKEAYHFDPETNSDEFTLIEYNLVLNLGENIVDAHSLLDINEPLYYKTENESEFIQLNIYFKVSENNNDYYSQDGIVYTK